MPIFPFFRLARKPEHRPSARDPIAPVTRQPPFHVRRHFYNEPGFQCFASFFPVWKGWATAGHVLTHANHNWPNFTGSGKEHIWPGGLDAALRGCKIPKQPPPAPRTGQKVIALGYPAGSRAIESRQGKIYIERRANAGHWIMHINEPDEPVVTGMSGGPVIDALTNEPLGVIITRNSPADLDADRDPDESCDFISLQAIWHAIRSPAPRV